MAELTLEESVQQILPTLPLPIQKFFEQRKLGEITRLLMERYALHVDQGAILERELIFLLLGLKNPDEFAAELYEQLPISQQTVRDMIADINQEVFVPLRAEEMKAEQPAKPAAPRPMNAPVPTYAQRHQVASQPVGVVGPPPQSPTYFHREGNVSQFIRRAQPANPQQPPRHVVAPSGVEPAVAKPAVPIPPPPRQGSQTPIKPVADEKLLEDHEEPHIEFNKSSVPPNLPGTTVAPKINLPVIPIPPKPTAPPAPVKPYSSDPYREPIENS